MLKDLMLKYLAKTNGISEKQAATLLFKKVDEKSDDLDETTLNDDVLKTLLAKDAERVKNLAKEPDTTKVFDNGHKKGTKEAREKFEKDLRARYGVDSENKLKLDDLLTKIDSENAKKVGSELTEENVKKHPAFLALENSKKTEIDELTTTHADALAKIENDQASATLLSSVKSTGLGYFDALNPILSKDTVKATNQRNNFSSVYDNYDYQKSEVEGEDPIVINRATGERLEDEHGNRITLKQLSGIEAGKYYDFAVQTQKGNAGNDGNGGGSGGVVVPTSEDEYNIAIQEAKTEDERIEIADAWEASKSD